jgi:hypothetical protein
LGYPKPLLGNLSETPPHSPLLPFFSSPVIGQKTGVLYQYETSTGIKWKTFGNEKVQHKYEGEIKNGDMWFILHGMGVIIFPYDDKSIIGEWKNGKEWNTKHRKKDGTFIGRF